MLFDDVANTSANHAQGPEWGSFSAQEFSAFRPVRFSSQYVTLRIHKMLLYNVSPHALFCTALLVTVCSQTSFPI